MKPKIMNDSWYNQLEFIFKSSQYKAVIDKLRNSGQRLCPDPANIFKAFSYFPFGDTRVVMVFLSPYQYARPDGILYATGLATAIPDNKYDRDSLSLMRVTLDVDYPSELEFDNTLEHWAKQGILLLNPALTVPINSSDAKAHLDLWNPITKMILQVISATLTGVVFVPFGGVARDSCKVVNRVNHYVIDNIPHPAAYSYAKKKYGVHDVPEHLDLTKSGVFRKIDEILENLNKEKINWYV